MKKIWSHLKRNVFRGLIALIPLALVYLVIHFIYLYIESNVRNLFDEYMGIWIPGLGLILTAVFLYAVGVFSGNIIGGWMLHKLEKLTSRIPLIGSTYQVGKQISNTLLLPEKQVFQKAVLVNYLKDTVYTIGFVTGTITDKDTGEKLYKVFIPTPPIPTTGVVLILEEKEVHDPGWTVDEAIRTVISAGIIGPEEVRFRRS